MSGTRGLWLAFGGGSHAERIALHIEEDNTFTTTLANSEIRPRPAEVAVVSLSGRSADYVGVAERGVLTGTDEIRVRVSSLVPLGAIPLADVVAALPSRHAGRVADLPTRASARIPPRCWELFLSELQDRVPTLRSHLADMSGIVASIGSGRTRRDVGMKAFERDALGVAIEAWGGSDLRKRVLRSAGAGPTAENAPFLDGLSDPMIREDPQVGHDHSVFPGFDLIARHQIGAARFEHPSGNTLTIVNSNRRPLEQTLGVDLIYYSHTYNAYTLVQYKRMRQSGAGSSPAYRESADSSFASEVASMTRVEERLRSEMEGAEALALSDRRLLERPFFFKFCESTTTGPLDPSMIRGMYMPLDVVRSLRDESLAAGRRGLIVRWNQHNRYLVNSEFTRLLRRGWIGSAAMGSEWLSDLIRAVLNSGKMIVFAATSHREGEREFWRDERGRFADPDDPFSTL